MKRIIWFLLCATSFSQVSLIGTVGGKTGYKAPYAEGSVEAKHSFKHFLVGGEASGASGRKSDTGDGVHFGTRGFAGIEYKGLSVAGGFSYSKQWTSLYEKQAQRPILYVGFKQLDAFLIFKGNDIRNGQQGIEVRWTEMFQKHWGVRLQGGLLRGYQTDRPKEPISIGGAQAGIVYRF
jgi:hypothetical protein